MRLSYMAFACRAGHQRVTKMSIILVILIIIKPPRKYRALTGMAAPARQSLADVLVAETAIMKSASSGVEARAHRLHYRAAARRARGV